MCNCEGTQDGKSVKIKAFSISFITDDNFSWIEVNLELRCKYILKLNNT